MDLGGGLAPPLRSCASSLVSPIPSREIPKGICPDKSSTPVKSTGVELLSGQTPLGRAEHFLTRTRSIGRATVNVTAVPSVLLSDRVTWNPGRHPVTSASHPGRAAGPCSRAAAASCHFWTAGLRGVCDSHCPVKHFPLGGLTGRLQ